jgi:hypothetical protein
MHTKDNQAAIGATADVNNKATQNDGANASPVTVSNGSHSMHHDMLKVCHVSFLTILSRSRFIFCF